MIRCPIALLAIAWTGGLVAVEDPAPGIDVYPMPDALLRIDAPDAGASLARWWASPLGVQVEQLAAAEGGAEFERVRAMLDGFRRIAGEITALPEGDEPVAVAFDIALDAAALDILWEEIDGGEDATAEEGDFSYRRREDGVEMAAFIEPTPIAGRSVGEDLVMSWNADAIRTAIGEDAPAELLEILAELSDGHYLLEIGTDQVTEHILLARELAPLGLQAVDADIASSVPEDAIIVHAAGLDVPRLVALLGDEAREGFEDLTAAASQQGIAIDTDELLADLSGTWLIWVRPGAPFPHGGLQLPSGVASDALITTLAGQLGITPPDVGAVISLPREVLGPAPVEVLVARREGAWLVTTDRVSARTWVAGQPLSAASGGIGAQLAAEAAAGALVCGVSDTPRVAELALGYLPLMEPRVGPQVVASAFDVVEELVTAPTGSLVIHDGEGESRITLRGQLPFGLIVPAIAVPNLLASRVVANESAASNSLRTIHSAMETYRAMRYNNLDSDDTGEYGFLSQLAGGMAAFGTTGANGVVAGEIGLLSEDFRIVAAFPFSGYRFKVYLSDGADGALDAVEAQRRIEAGDTAWADIAERHYVVYAWPAVPGETGTTVFAMTERGRVLSAPVETVELPPVWHAAFGDPTGRSAQEIFSNPIWP